MTQTNYEFTVTRQRRWPDGLNIVEITQGGKDYTGSDALVERYPGEFQTYIGLEEATLAAISIARLWKHDSKGKIYIL